MVAQASSYMTSPCFAFAGGGTGGHLFPPIAVAQALREMIPGSRFVFFGTERPLDRHILGTVDAESVVQPLPRLTGSPWHWPTILLKLRQCGALCKGRFQLDRPSVVVGTGGMASVPAVREAHRLKIPIAIFNPDALPGKANRFLAKSAGAVFVQWEDSTPHFRESGSVHVTGCPIRSEFRTADRDAGLRRFQLNPDKKTLLVTGASQGARTINEAITAVLPALGDFSDWQVLHLTGETDFSAVRDAYAGQGVSHVLLPFTPHMAEALAASDLVVSRAGASTLAEITALGKPSILLPYPFHKDRHQEANARCLARVDAAVIVCDCVDRAVNGRALWEALRPLLMNPDQRERMARAARNLGRPDAAKNVAERLSAMANAPSRGGAADSLEVLC